MEPQIILKNIYEELKKIEMSMITRDDMNRFVETFEILSNPETMAQINQSERDINSENVQEINSMNDL